MNKEPYIINGGIFTDARGTLRHVNAFDFSSVKRFYQVQNSSTEVIRAWQGHKVEEKYFFVGQGVFLIALVEIDNWEQPSDRFPVKTFILSAAEPAVLFVPGGFANGVKALEPGSILTVFSNCSIEESAADTFRFDPTKWFDWNQV